MYPYKILTKKYYSMKDHYFYYEDIITLLKNIPDDGTLEMVDDAYIYTYDTYKMYAMILVISFVIELAIIDSIYFYHIQNNMKLSNNVELYLSMIMGMFPAIGILLSTINIPDTEIFLDTVMHIFLISCVMYIKPLYNSTQILVHLLICFTGYQMVLNNMYHIKNQENILNIY